jgi:hypothetical protein
MFWSYPAPCIQRRDAVPLQWRIAAAQASITL